MKCNCREYHAVPRQHLHSSTCKCECHDIGRLRFVHTLPSGTVVRINGIPVQLFSSVYAGSNTDFYPVENTTTDNED